TGGAGLPTAPPTRGLSEGGKPAPATPGPAVGATPPPAGPAAPPPQGGVAPPLIHFPRRARELAVPSTGGRIRPGRREPARSRAMSNGRRSGTGSEVRGAAMRCISPMPRPRQRLRHALPDRARNSLRAADGGDGNLDDGARDHPPRGRRTRNGGRDRV